MPPIPPPLIRKESTLPQKKKKKLAKEGAFQFSCDTSNSTIISEAQLWFYLTSKRSY